MIKRYYGSLRQVYFIITSEIPSIESDLALQMSFKAINNFVGPNGLVSTLLVFGVYSRMTEQNAPSLLITQRAMAKRKTIDEVQRFTPSQKINNVLNT